MTLLTQPGLRFGSVVADLRTGKHALVVGWLDGSKTVAVLARKGEEEYAVPVRALALIRSPRDWKARKRG
jgi:hypothetical protein